MLKRRNQWVLATILVICGTTVLTSCSKDDDKTIYGDGVVKTDFTFPAN